MNFKCSVCKKKVNMNKEIKLGYNAWVYEDCIQWTDLVSELPPLESNEWRELSNNTPVIGEKKILFVTKPFDEEEGNVFLSFFEPSYMYLNGFDIDSANDIKKCAIVKCKYDETIQSNDYCAYIRVSVLEVVLIQNLCAFYPENKVNESIDYFGMMVSELEVIYQDESWTISAWSGEGDIGECNWIYTDSNGKRHLVMQDFFTFDEEILYIGNIVEE